MSKQQQRSEGDDFADAVAAIMGHTRRMVNAERTLMNRPSAEVEMAARRDYVNGLLDLMELRA